MNGNSAAPQESLVQDRLAQVFKFLKELHELRNPVSRDLGPYSQVLRIDAWPLHPTVVVRRGDRTDDADESGDAEMEPLIRIARAVLTACPAPPASLDGWLNPGWQDANADAEVLESRNVRDDKDATVTIAFADDYERVAALKSWTAVRARWAEAERPAIAARQVFDRIHVLWTAMQREGDRSELVIADGMLAVPEQAIRHPVLMQRVMLDFEPSIPEFRLATGTEKVELNRALLRLVPAIEGRMIAQFNDELETQPVEPLGGDTATSFFKRLAQGLFRDGEFLETPGAISDRPTIWREPLIFVRPRNAGLSTSLDNIIEDLQDEDSKPPPGLGRIVGVEEDEHRATSGAGTAESPPTPIGAIPDILFSKPANREQYEIASRLSESNAVLVQGPPGTGKTHTIANLLGYLLAQGKSVLVTAHTTKALRVLRGQVDKALQPLCLSVLDSDASSQTQLSHAAQEIADRLSGAHAPTLRREAGLLRDKRNKLLETRAEFRRRLRDARFSEVEEIVFAGEGLPPVEVAKRVKVDKERDGWIPGPIQPGLTCPLTDAESRQLYSAAAAISASDERQLSVSQPDSVQLVTPSDFRLLAGEQTSAESRAEKHRPELWGDGGGVRYSSAQLQDLHRRVCAAAEVLAEDQHWLREVLFAGWLGGDLRETWHDLVHAAERLSNAAAKAHRLIVEHGPELPEGPAVEELAETFAAIIAHLDGGNSLGLMTKLRHRDWHQLIERCRVDGRLPTKLAEFHSLSALAEVQNLRTRFAARWRRAVEALGGPQIESAGTLPERAAQSYMPEIRTRLEWRYAVWEPLIGELRSAGFRWDTWLAEHPPVTGDHGELARVRRAGSQALVELVEAQSALLRQAELAAALQNQRSYLAGFPQSEIAAVLLLAQDSWSVDTYEEACRELSRLEGLRSAYGTRQALLAKVDPVAPVWSHAIRQRHKRHDDAQPAGDTNAAWRWCQWHQELERRAAVSMPELQERLEKLEKELQDLAVQIIENETWAAQKERTGLQAQQALMGFVQTIRKIGKGTGKNVPQLLRQARELLASARSAVPVWIMPLSRVYESFDARVTKFDVVIIDEASQSDVTALAALYLGCQHVVVGDKEQVTPDAVGQRIDQVQRLIATDLRGIPNSHLYDGQTSIYDLAEAAFGGVVALREHFRSVPEIIQFCNHLSYGGKLLPLRPSSASPQNRCLIVPHRVNGYRDERRRTNDVEAEEIASLIVACLDDVQYRLNDLGGPTTFGVISLVGDDQALIIDTILRRRVPPDVYARHRILCGNAAQFQGDERDIIFLSMVDGPPTDGQLTMRDAGPKDLYKKRYNVAVSRARNQLWVVHSVDPDTHLKPGDLRQRLIAHARDPLALLRAMEEQGKRTDSPYFEKPVLERLMRAGYRVHPQWQVGSRRIDLVVEGTTKWLAVECDGEKWHTPEQLQQDLERQAILERLGWVFVRIRGSVFFRDPDTAMAPVFAKLEQLGIETLGVASEVPPAEQAALLCRVRRRAEAVRTDWRADVDNVVVDPPERISPRPTPADDLFRPATQPAAGLTPTAPVATTPRVEVDDSVRYRLINGSEDEVFVTIVEGASNPILGMINRETAIAKALIGMEQGQEREVLLPEGKRTLRVVELLKPTRRHGLSQAASS